MLYSSLALIFKRREDAEGLNGLKAKASPRRSDAYLAGVVPPGADVSATLWRVRPEAHGLVLMSRMRTADCQHNSDYSDNTGTDGTSKRRVFAAARLDLSHVNSVLAH